jgi:hypothetical protein
VTAADGPSPKMVLAGEKLVVGRYSKAPALAQSSLGYRGGA